MEAGELCGSCGQINNRKKGRRCSECSGFWHLSCVGLTRAQASSLRRWSCAGCRGIVGAVPQQQGEIDLGSYISKCRVRLRVLNRIPSRHPCGQAC